MSFYSYLIGLRKLNNISIKKIMSTLGNFYKLCKGG